MTGFDAAISQPHRAEGEGEGEGEGRLILHIGFGKTATTVMQNKILPQVARAYGMTYAGTRSMRPFLDARAADLPIAPFARLSRGAGCLISCEALIGWDPHDWMRNLTANRAHFGPQATILLIIRQPKSYLRSAYQQLCHHKGQWLYPPEFFKTAARYDQHSTRAQFDLTAYDLPALVAAYSRQFAHVVVQKYETLSDGRYLRALFGADDVQIERAADVLAHTRSNRSYSRRAVALGFAWAHWAERHLGIPWLEPAGTLPRRSRADRLFRNAMQLGLDRLLPYEPYEIDWSAVPGARLALLTTAYAAMPDFVTYRDGLVDGAAQAAIPPATDFQA